MMFGSRTRTVAIQKAFVDDKMTTEEYRMKGNLDFPPKAFYRAGR